MRLFLALVIILLTSQPVFSAITFTDGVWESTFDCTEQSQGSFSCDGLGNGIYYSCDDGVEEKWDQITSDANYTSGDGGRGFRHWVDDGTDNDHGGGIGMLFPSAQQEFWFRFYARYEAGFQWVSITYDKVVYVWTEKGSNEVPYAVFGFGYNDSMIAKDGLDPFGSPEPPAQNPITWNDIMGGSTSDGEWHAYEFHLKMDTLTGGVSNEDGEVHTWVDGVPIASKTDWIWSDEDATAAEGFRHFLIGSNQKEANNGGCTPMDYDDIVVYTTTPPNTDSNGHPYIGLLGAGSLGTSMRSGSTTITSGSTTLK